MTLDGATSASVLLLVALALDAIFGEPDVLWRRAPHPATLMGRAVDALDRLLNQGGEWRRRVLGVVAAASLLVGGAAIGWGLAVVPFAGPFLEAFGAAILLAQRSLVEHVARVASALRLGLAEGRRAVAMIVGRDPESLDEAGVGRAAIESCAENFSDGVVAPAFWFLVGGLPGIVAYKAINTADSMIGHRTPRHEAFGWASARLDDALNWIPARLSGLLIAIAAGARFAQAVAAMRRDARRHKSPNAGWPEAATAGALDLALAGPRRYAGAVTDDPFLNADGRRVAGPDDIDAAVRLIWRAWWALLVLVAAFAAFLGSDAP